MRTRLTVAGVAALLSGLGVFALPQTSVGSPQVDADRRVTFRLAAPGATKVQVVVAVSPAELSRGGGFALPMRREGEIWTAVTEPLAPDIYAYQFVVDGTRLEDPANARFIEEFGGVRTSAFAVSGAVWTTPAPKSGAISRPSRPSGGIDGSEEFLVYTPPGYDRTRAEPYPVLYLLHGMGDNEHTLVTNGGVNVTLDNLIAQGRVVPMVVVMPVSYGGTGRALTAIDGVESALVRDVIPRAEQALHVVRGREGRAIAGISMGGSHAVTLALRHPKLFAWVASLSGAFQMGAAGQVEGSGPPAPGQFSLIYLGWGADDELALFNRTVTARLRAGGAEVVSKEVAGIGHSWTLWRGMLGELAELLFKPASR